MKGSNGSSKKLHRCTAAKNETNKKKKQPLVPISSLVSNRIDLLFSWNFLPKSWFYIAFNDYRVQDEEGRLQLQNRIGAVKAKYLIYF